MGPEIIATVVSVVATGLSALVSSAASSKVLEIFKFVSGVVRTAVPEPPTDGVTIRLNEARAELHRQQSLAKAHRVAGWLLTAGQFIVGGLLASSFVQQSLSKEIIGVLGVLVLASSLIRQHYRPDLQLAGARERATKLKATIREVEDFIYMREEGQPNAPQPQEIRKILRDALGKIEADEVRELGASVVAQPKTVGKRLKATEAAANTGVRTDG